MVVYLDAFQYSTSKGLRRNMFFLSPFACSFVMFFLREVNVSCILNLIERI